MTILRGPKVSFTPAPHISQGAYYGSFFLANTVATTSRSRCAIVNMEAARDWYNFCESLYPHSPSQLTLVADNRVEVAQDLTAVQLSCKCFSYLNFPYQLSFPDLVNDSSSSGNTIGSEVSGSELAKV